MLRAVMMDESEIRQTYFHSAIQADREMHTRNDWQHGALFANLVKQSLVRVSQTN